jgi:hypothetical protein
MGNSLPLVTGGTQGVSRALRGTAVVHVGHARWHRIARRVPGRPRPRRSPGPASRHGCHRQRGDHGEDQRGRSVAHASPTSIDELVAVAELAERKLAAATDPDDVGELLTHVGTAREIAHGRTNVADHLCKLLAAASDVRAREGLPADLHTEAATFSDTARTTLANEHAGHNCPPADRPVRTVDTKPRVTPKPAVMPGPLRPSTDRVRRPKIARVTVAGGVLLGTATALTLGLVGVRVHRGERATSSPASATRSMRPAARRSRRANASPSWSDQRVDPRSNGGARSVRRRAGGGRRRPGRRGDAAPNRAGPDRAVRRTTGRWARPAGALLASPSGLEGAGPVRRAT